MALHIRRSASRKVSLVTMFAASFAFVTYSLSAQLPRTAFAEAPDETFVTDHVVINEIFPNPAADNDEGEWVELYNPTDKDISLEGWTLGDDDGDSDDIKDEDWPESLAAHAFVAVEIDDLNNFGGDTVILTDDSGRSYKVAYGSLGQPEIHEGKSWARVPDGSEEWKEYDPTKGGPNDTVPPTLTLSESTATRTANGAKLVVEGSASDAYPNGGIDSCQYQISAANDADHTSDAEETDAAEAELLDCNSVPEEAILANVDVADLPSGNYTVTITVTDVAGNETAKSFPLAVDHPAPVLTISGPDSMKLDGTASLTITSTQPVRNLLVVINGEEQTDSVAKTDGENTWTVTYTPPATGSYEVTASADALYGNAESDVRTAASYDFTVIANPPTETQKNNASQQLQQVTNRLTQPLQTIAATTPVTVPVADKKDEKPSDTAVLGTETTKEKELDLGAIAETPAIAASEEGWKIFGIAWYWWTVLIAVVVATIWRMAAVRRQKQQIL